MVVAKSFVINKIGEFSQRQDAYGAHSAPFTNQYPCSRRRDASPEAADIEMFQKDF